MKRAAVAVALAIAAFGSSPAIADSRAEAIVLFDQGIKDMKAGRLDKACAELQASLDMVKDSGTKGALARCHGLAGRVASAWLLWRELADTAPSAALRNDAAAQATKLEPRLPKYTIKVARGTPNVVVEINGRSVASNVPVAVPIDPGEISVSASGREGDRVTTEVWTHDYTAEEGETVAIEVPALAPRVAPKVKVKPVKPAPDHSAEVAGRRHTRHVIALVIGGLGIGAGTAGAVFGFDARSKFAEAEKICGGKGKIDECPVGDTTIRAKKQVDAANTSATRSTILVGAAGGAVVIAAIVWLTAPSLETKRVAVVPTVGSGSVGLVLGGAF